jgi:hypothetical protein
MCHEDLDRMSASQTGNGRPLVRGLPTPANEVTESWSLISGVTTVGVTLDACSLTIIGNSYAQSFDRYVDRVRKHRSDL